MAMARRRRERRLVEAAAKTHQPCQETVFPAPLVAAYFRDLLYGYAVTQPELLRASPLATQSIHQQSRSARASALRSEILLGSAAAACPAGGGFSRIVHQLRRP